jgi:hypothetical protein
MTGHLDLGEAVLIVAGGTAAVRRVLLEQITAESWDEARAGFGDDDLASE